MKKQLKKYNARVEDMKTSGDAAQLFKKDAQLDKAMNDKTPCLVQAIHNELSDIMDK
jgi:hypothetical protein